MAGRGDVRLLGLGDIRALSARLGLRPAKARGQNFVVDPATVRRLVTSAAPDPADVVLEVGPGFGSLTLALLPAAARVVAVEVDRRLADELPRTVAARAPRYSDRLAVVTADAARVGRLPGEPPTVLVANLPYSAAVAILLHVLATVPTVRRGLVMVQAEVAERICAPPGSRVYAGSSAKLAWFVAARPAGRVPRTVFWPVPGVDSRLVAVDRVGPPSATTSRAAVFAVIDAAFAQRRKTLRAALSGWAGSAPLAERLIRDAGLDPGARGESLNVAQFARLAQAGDIR